MNLTSLCFSALAILLVFALQAQQKPAAIARQRLDELSAPGTPYVYSGSELATIAMPVGGLFAGQLYFKGDGSLAHWDIMNGRCFGTSALVRPSPSLQQGFAVRVRDSGGELTSFPLNLKTFPATTFTADYPAGVVGYAGAQDQPLRITLEGIAPFVPLAAAASGIPATFLRLTLENTRGQAIEGDVLGWLQNGASGLSGMLADEGSRIATVRQIPGALAVEFAAQPSASAAANLEKSRPPILLADFETTDYMGWNATGGAFGVSPTQYETQSNGAIQGSAGDGCASSLPQRTAAIGNLESPAFLINRNTLRFLVAGVRDQQNLRIELRSGEQLLHTAYPRNNQKAFIPVTWDLRAHAGKMARVVVIDDSISAGMMVDQFELLDENLPPLKDRPDFGTMALVLLDPAAAAQALPSVQGNLAAGAAPVTAEAIRPFDQIQVGALTAPFRLQAGETTRFTFAIAWHFPNLELTEWGKLQGKGRWYGNHHASASAVVDKLASSGLGLVSEIDLWRETYYDSTLPRWLLDRSIANLSALATGTCFRFADGRFYGFEGVYSFPGTCNHVWHYEEGAGRLFPELEMSLRTQADFVPAVGFKSDGSIAMRIDGQPGSPDPLPSTPILFGQGYQHWASIDGQCGILLRTYRTHLLGNDDSFVKNYWPKIRLATEWLLAQDSDGDGLPDLLTHHTLDEDISGPSPWISSLNLAALTAAAKMAAIAGDDAFAALCQQRIASGQKNFIAKLWKGDRFAHLSPESEKWRPGSYDGSHIDQVLGQQWAWRNGLGRILPEKETRAALASIFRNNFMPDVGSYYEQPENKPSRVFAKAGTGGTLIATWPAGSYRPDGKLPDHPWNSENHFHQGFYNETMSGFEHAFASHLIYEGMVAEGLTVTRAIHDRHQPSSPMKGNPFNEPEAGNHYARAMASYATSLACGGFEYDGPAGRIGFAPRLQADNFKAAFTAAEGWGSFSQKTESGNLKAELALRWGKLRLRSVSLATVFEPAAATVTVNGKSISAKVSHADGTSMLTFPEDLTLTAGQTVSLLLNHP